MADRVHQATTQQANMVIDRRHLHANPEIGLQLPDTHAWVADRLCAVGLDPELHPGAGISVRFAGTDPDVAAKPTTILRVDMDALPVTERTRLPFQSRRPGVMHACGHDLHTAVGLAVARILIRHPPNRNTVLTFQPGEETDRGAVPTLSQHRNLQILGPANAFAVHMHAQVTTGHILLREGVFMARGDWFSVSFSGPGGHASMPENAGNPIVAGSNFINALTNVVGALNKTEHAVAIVTEFLSGNTVNVIPQEALLRGTIRTLSEQTRKQLISILAELVDEQESAAAVQGAWKIHEGYPALINDKAYTARVCASLAKTSLSDQVTVMDRPSMVIEDFSYFLQQWPGMMVYVGAHIPGCNSFNHADNVQFDEVAMTTSLALYLLAADGWPV